jgi:hypothetical protein
MKATGFTAIDQTYLLRCWTVRSSATSIEWRFTLVHPYTNARRTFTTAAALVDFLETQLTLTVTATTDLPPLSKQIDD